MNDPREPIQEHVPAPKPETRSYPTPEFRFFIYDPDSMDFTYYKSAAERDEDSQWKILDHLVDGWSEEVSQIVAGEMTHHTIMHDVVKRPERENFESDKAFETAIEEYGIDAAFSYKCNYKLGPLDECSEPEPA